MLNRKLPDQAYLMAMMYMSDIYTDDKRTYGILEELSIQLSHKKSYNYRVLSI